MTCSWPHLTLTLSCCHCFPSPDRYFTGKQWSCALAGGNWGHRHSSWLAPSQWFTCFSRKSGCAIGGRGVVQSQLHPCQIEQASVSRNPLAFLAFKSRQLSRVSPLEIVYCPQMMPVLIHVFSGLNTEILGPELGLFQWASWNFVTLFNKCEHFHPDKIQKVTCTYLLLTLECCSLTRSLWNFRPL